MSFNGSYTATLSSPTASDGFGSQILSTSVSSLSSSSQSSRHSPSHISKTYRQASQLFLTRRLPEALSTVQPLITPETAAAGPDGAAEPAPVAKAPRSTRIKVWSLYLTILNAILELEPAEGKDTFGTQEWRALCHKVREAEIWEEVVKNGYHGVEGEVDSEVVINLATLLLAHARTQTTNQMRLESYLASAQEPNMDISQKLQEAQAPRLASRKSRSQSRAKGAGGTDTPRDLNARVKILELYTLHVLLRNNEWDYAREFISLSSVLDEERRDAFLQALQSLREDQQEQERMEKEQKQRQDDELRRDLEEAKQLRAENEARERRRLDEERSRREGSEVDYGVEGTPSAAGSSKPRHGRSASSAVSKPKSPPARGKAVAPKTFSARAAKIMSNFQVILHRMAATMQTNPRLLMQLIAFIIGLMLMLGQKRARERIARALATGWAKVQATAGMGVKVSYI